MFRAFFSLRCIRLLLLLLLQVDRERFLIYKQFSLCFVNRYCSLFYVAFWLQDLAKLRVLLIVLLFASAV